MASPPATSTLRPPWALLVPFAGILHAFFVICLTPLAVGALLGCSASSAPPPTPATQPPTAAAPMTTRPTAQPAPRHPAPTRSGPHALNGIALSLYYEGPGPELTYEKMIDRIAAAGAPAVSIVAQWAQPDVLASEIRPHPRETTPDAELRRVIRYARSRGLRVLLFPILWVEQRAIGQWRGTLKPADPERWWASYRRFIGHYARLAAEERVEALSVGSEFASLEGETARWHRIIDETRAVFSGQLIYSANWDHYREVTFWDRLDAIGLTGYYRLVPEHAPGSDPDLATLTAAWQRIRTELLAWRATVDRPLIFTELGYPSADGAAFSPWDYTGTRAIDHEEQRRCFEAFSAVWGDTAELAGVFFWNGWGPIDGRNTWYTFWGKPAEAVVRRWFAADAQKTSAEN